MQIRISILRTVHLYNPIHSWEVHSSRCNISTEEKGVLTLNKTEVNSSSLPLLLPSMEFKHTDPRFKMLETLICKSNLLTTLEEHNAFLILVGFHETEEGVHLQITWYLHTVVVQFRGSCMVLREVRVIHNTTLWVYLWFIIICIIPST